MNVAQLRTTLLDPHQEALLERYGFARIPFLDADGIASLRAVHERHGAAPDDPGVALYFGHQSKSIEHKRAVSDALRAVVRDRVAQVFADHDMYLTMFITKWPGANSGFGPHQDPTLVDERTFRGVTIWIPLVDTGVIDGKDNGMLQVVPGSHTFVQGPRGRDVNVSVFAEHEADIVERFGVGVPTRLGEAIVFDNRLIHYSMPNESDEPRVVVSLGMRPREASCVYLRENAAGHFDQYAVDDDWFIEVNAAGVDLWQPDAAPEATLEPIREVLTRDRFAALCEAVGHAPGTVPRYVPASGAGAVNPGSFCAYCGTSVGLEDRDRTGRGKAQFLCASCSAELAAKFVADPDLEATTDADVEAPPAADDPTSVPEPPTATPLRLLFVGVAPTGDGPDDRLRRSLEGLATAPGVELRVAWLLDGPARSAWAEIGGDLVIDDLRTWKAAVALERRAPRLAGRLRGLRMRAELWRLGRFDAVLLQHGVGDRVVAGLRHEPTVVAGLWNDATVTPTSGDVVRTNLDLAFAEEGCQPATSGPTTTYSTTRPISRVVPDAIRAVIQR